MTKTQSIKALKQALTFGNPELTKTINVTTYTSPLKVVCEILLSRIKSGFIKHDEYWMAVYGLQYCVCTGRAVYVIHHLDKLDVQETLALIEDIKRSCQSFGDIEAYLNTTFRHKMAKAA